MCQCTDILLCLTVLWPKAKELADPGLNCLKLLFTQSFASLRELSKMCCHIDQRPIHSLYIVSPLTSCLKALELGFDGFRGRKHSDDMQTRQFIVVASWGPIHLCLITLRYYVLALFWNTLSEHTAVLQSIGWAWRICCVQPSTFGLESSNLNIFLRVIIIPWEWMC